MQLSLDIILSKPSLKNKNKTKVGTPMPKDFKPREKTQTVKTDTNLGSMTSQSLAVEC
jgi:hypothetical protein